MLAPPVLGALGRPGLLRPGDEAQRRQAQVGALEHRRGVTPRPIHLGIPGRRAQELLISPGDLVEIVGRVDRVDDLFDDGRDYRGSPTVLCLRAPPGEPLLVRILGDTLPV